MKINSLSEKDKTLHMVFNHERRGTYIGTSSGAPRLEGMYDRFTYSMVIEEVRSMAACGAHPGAVIFWGTKAECEYFLKNKGVSK